MRRLLDNYDKAFYAFTAFSVGLYILFRGMPNWAEVVYGKGLFPILRNVADWSIGWLGFPFIYIIFIVVLVAFGIILRHDGLKGQRFRRAIQLVVMLILLFFWNWGFNYARPTIKQKLNIEVPAVDSSLLYDMYDDLIDSLMIWREELVELDYAVLEKEVRIAVGDWLAEQQMDHPGRPRIRQLKPAGILLGIQTAGIFLPFSLEAHIDAGLHPLVWPQVMAHEVAHSFGVTDEGECNFIAILACERSRVADLRYSAGLYELKLLFSALVRAGADRDKLTSAIGSKVLEDIRAIDKKHDSYPNYFPEALRNWIYDHYLKSQGVSSGLKSYGEVLGLLIAWRGGDQGPR